MFKLVSDQSPDLILERPIWGQEEPEMLYATVGHKTIDHRKVQPLHKTTRIHRSKHALRWSLTLFTAQSRVPRAPRCVGCIGSKQQFYRLVILLC